MQRRPPSPSPGPRWEALKDTTTTDSSGEEDEITEDTDSVAIQPTSKSQAALKRKEAEQLGSTSKRPRHEQDRRQSEGDLGNSGSNSASAPSRFTWPQKMDNSVASSSTANATSAATVNKNIPAGSRVSSSSMLPPPLPSKVATDDPNANGSLPLPMRPRPTPIFKTSSQNTTSSLKSTSQVSKNAEASSSHRKDFPSTLSTDLFGRKPSSQAGPSSSKRSISFNDAPKSQAHHRKSRSTTTNEVIDLCLEDSPPLPPKPKTRLSLPNTVINMPDDEDTRPIPRKMLARKSVMLARKSVGGRAPRKCSLPKPSSHNQNEVIEISSDSDDAPSKPVPSSSLPKKAEKRVVTQKPFSVSMPKNQKRPPGSKSASESDSMKIDDPITAVSTRTQAPASVPAPATRKRSKPVPSEDMQVDALVPAVPSASARPQPLKEVRQTVPSNLPKRPEQIVHSGSHRVAPALPASDRVASKRLSSQDMQADGTEIVKSTPSIIRPQTTAHLAQPSSSSISQPHIPRPTAIIPKVIPKPASSKQESNPNHAPDSHNSSKPTQFKRAQVAIKSTNGLKHRQRGYSTSPSSSSNGSNSGNEEEEPSSGHNSPRASSADAGIDMRGLDHALGLEEPFSNPRTPERMISVKEQPISPEISQSAKPKQPIADGPATQGQQEAQTLRKPAISAPQLDVTLQHRGNTIESAIDLTSDNEDALTNDLTLKSVVANSQKLAGALSKLKGKGRAPQSSPTPPPHPTTPRSGTDELLLRPLESEPSPPPVSPSPPVQSPFVPIPDFPKTSQGSSRIEVERKQQSAPLVLAEDTSNRSSESQAHSSRLLGVLSNSPKTTPLPKPHIRSTSLGSKAQSSLSVTSTHNTQDADVFSKANDSLPSVISPPKFLRKRAISVTPISQPKSQSPSDAARAKSPLSGSVRSPSAVPGSKAANLLTDVASEAVDQERSTLYNASNDNADAPSAVSDIEMQDDMSDDDAMQETEEVQALVEEHGEDIFESADESRPASAISRFDSSNEAGPSGSSSSMASTNRRPSRRSSRSSTSEAWRIPSDDEPILQESDFASRDTTPEEGPISATSRGKTLGGFPAITWKEYRQDLANFTPKCLYGRNLPHALQDHINNMSEYTRKMPAIRDVFQAMIQENTIENEPHAPPIELLNDIDDEPTPPWEFHYTNEMWHGEGVPPPDIKNLTSCTCKGVCNPKSKTCACLIRQREASGDPNAEFGYDKAGRLRILGWPVNECNDLCGCGDECRNRVVQHGRKVQISIKKTKSKGWGVFAGSKKIYKGTFIGIYSGELLTDAEAHKRGVNYNKFGRTYLFDLDFHHLKEGANEGWTSKFTVDAYHAGNFTRFLNHSCEPNCILQPIYINEGNLEKPLLVIFSERDIEPYEEICFNYRGDDEVEKKPDEPGSPSKTDKIYARCMCGAANCTGNMFNS